MQQIEAFLLGVIVTASLVAGAFFFRFWSRTRDPLFLAFGTAFVVEAINRASLLLLDNPSAANSGIYMVRLLSYLLILFAIIHKNRT